MKVKKAVLTSIAISLFSSGALLAQGGTWTSEAPMPTGRGGLAVAVVDGILYAVGGVSPLSSSFGGVTGTLEAYDPKTNTWTTKAPMPTPRGDVAAIGLNGLLYVIGGNRYVPVALVAATTVEAYDPKTNTWSTKAPMSVPRLGLALAALNGQIFAVGGWSLSTGFLNSVESYDPRTDTWTTRQPMTVPREGLAAATVGGIVYAVGGATAISYLATAEAYNPQSDSWSTRAPMPTPRALPAAGVIDGNLYMVGGIGNNNPPPYQQYLSTTEAYDPNTNTWRSCSPMPTPRIGLAAGVIEDTLYAVGGDRILPDLTLRWLATNEAFSPFLPVTIEINPNTINLKSNAKIKVAILSSSMFDATSVIPDSVKLSGALAATEANGTPLFSFDDVNGDGILDLVLTFRARDLQLTNTDTQAVLKGQTFAGQLVKGVASVRIVP